MFGSGFTFNTFIGDLQMPDSKAVWGQIYHERIRLSRLTTPLFNQSQLLSSPERLLHRAETRLLLRHKSTHQRWKTTCSQNLDRCLFEAPWSKKTKAFYRMFVETYKIHRNIYTCNGKLYCIELCCVPLSQSRTRFVKKKSLLKKKKKKVCCYLKSLQDKELKGKHNLDIEWSNVAN